jgi:peptidoglycan/LPS O-acetylase OafA/YrhL
VAADSVPIYRPDIDGLRGIAIIAVVLFHAGFATFSGGFVGVDVFFVISGCLITGLILPEIREGRFSLLAFYERRIRRLLPALVAMLAVTSLACCALLMPDDLAEYGASLGATAAFVSNFLFWHDSGYFAQAAEMKPLLHTWSLAIEEQYYLIFPAMLLGARRYGAHLLVILTLLCAASLAVSAWSATAAPRAGFYLIPARFWELLLGALLAVAAVAAPPRRLWRDAVIASGLVLIVGSAVGFDRTTPFPGTAALLPCLGTALVIWAGAASSSLQRLLSLPPMVGCGLISYSLYLWHWPLLTLLRQTVLREPTRLEIVATLALATLLAVLSWRWVERPFRGRSGLLGRRQLFITAALVSAAPIAAGAVFYVSGGLPQRLPADVVALADPARDHAAATRDCFNPTPARVRAAELCRIGAESVPPTFLLWGDSHADSIAGAVAAAAAVRGRAGLFAATAACPPLLDVWRVAGNGAANCTDFNHAVLQLASSEAAITTVILAARWVMAARGTRYKFEPGEPVTIRDAESRPGDDNAAVFRRGLARTLRGLAAAGKRIAVVGPVPEVGWPVPDALAKAKYFGMDLDIAPTLSEFETRQQPVFDAFAALQAEVAFTVIWPHQVLCDAQRCPVSSDGKTLYRDEEHVSAYGADRLIPLLEPVFDQSK